MILSSRRNPTNRWTGAAVARFASSLVRRRLNEFAPPGQLKRWAYNMQRKEILNATDLRLVVDSIFAVGNPTAYETFSRFDSDTLSFSNANNLCDYVALPRSRKDCFLGFSIYYPDAHGFIEKIRINLDQRRCKGHTFRYEMRGWGLIQFQIDLKDAPRIACRVAVNSQERANLWFDTIPELGSPDLWDWNVVEKHTRRLIRTLRKYAQQIVGPERGPRVSQLD